MKTWLSLGSNKCFFEMALSHKMQTHGALFSSNAYFWAQISRQGSSCHRGWYGSNVMTATHVWLHVAYPGVFSWVLRAILWGYHDGIIAFILQVRTCPQVSYTVNMSPSYNQSPGLHPPGLVCLLLTLPNETFTPPPQEEKMDTKNRCIWYHVQHSGRKTRAPQSSQLVHLWTKPPPSQVLRRRAQCGFPPQGHRICIPPVYSFSW